MQDSVDPHIRDERAGFLKERSCTDQIATPLIILEQSLELNRRCMLTSLTMKRR
ncbi:hypothetical protein DPMN_013750 [Dreissena polymorpha]|uniref:Uncharacterized protein n=1 Tax=Dreissena polymorpha TaxID=45954 RepID=A0A9D4N875_DREPO|nr:hypothetical protein DPMN_013750 [Dreissena polymorpha]